MSEPAAQPGAAPPEPAKPKKRRIGLVILAIVLIAAAAYGVRAYIHGRLYETTDDAFVEAHVSPISPRVPGHVVKVHIKENQIVKEGDVLVELDPADYDAKLKQAQAALAAAESRQRGATTSTQVTQTTTGAGVAQAEAGVGMAKAAVATSRGRLAEAEAAVKTAEAQLAAAKSDVISNQAEVTRTAADLRRFRELFEQKSIPKQQLEYGEAAATSASAKLEAAKSKVGAAEAQVTQAKAGVATATEAVKQSQSAQAEAEARLKSAQSAPEQVEVSKAQASIAAADVEQAKAALRQAELNLSYTTIKAPVAGRITRKNVEQGAYVQVGQPLLALVQSGVWVVANFKETQLARMQPGQSVSLHVDAYPDLEIEGTVDSIQSGTGARFSLLPAENATGNYVKVVQRVPVKITLKTDPAKAYQLAPGMSVEPKVRVR